MTAGNPGRVFEVGVRNGFSGERYSQTFRISCSGFFVRRIHFRFGLWISPLGNDQVSFGTWRWTWIGSLPGWFASIALSCFFFLFCPLALHFYCYYYSTDMSNLFCLPKSLKWLVALTRPGIATLGILTKSCSPDQVLIKIVSYYSDTV